MGTKRERDKQTDIHLREKHLLVASHMHPDWGWNPQPRYLPRLGMKPANFLGTGCSCNQLSHLAGAYLCTFKNICVYWPLYL